MRLSGLFVALTLLVSSLSVSTLWAQHSGGGSGSSGGGGSHGGFSGSSHSSSSSTAGSTAHASGVSTSSSHPSPSSNSKTNSESDKKSSRSFFHPFRKPVETSSLLRPPKCLKQPCAICPTGGLHNGACVAPSNSCLYGNVGNGFACGTQGFSADCRILAGQLAAHRRGLLGASDPSQGLIHQLLLDQYQQCLRRFNSYAFNGGLLFDVP